MNTKFNRIAIILGAMITTMVLAGLGVIPEKIVMILNAIGVFATPYIAIKGKGSSE